MELMEVKPDKVPLSLLLEGDPSESSISAYLTDSWCFVAEMDGIVVGACIVKSMAPNFSEVFNVSVRPEFQQKRIGTDLLVYAIQALKLKKIKRLELGTGSFGYQLAYYHRLGFRVDSVVKNHFTDNYAQPVYENGIQHKDMLRLYLDL